jgi:hypothetical protein
VFDHEGRAKPLRIILSVPANPFTRPLSKRPNERQRSLWQNPDVGFKRGPVHCLRSVCADGGSDLIPRFSLSAHLRRCLDRISKPLTVMISTEGEALLTSTYIDTRLRGRPISLGFRLAASVH